MMSHFFHTLGLLLMVLPLAAQMPDWYNAASRKIHYPPEAYYTGYVEGELQKGETLEDAIIRLKDAARVELVSTIRTTFEHTTNSRTQSELVQSTTDFEEQIHEIFSVETRISSSIKDIPGLQIEAYRNPSGGNIAAFAYVKRQTLVNQLTRRIAMLSGKAENDWQQAVACYEQGQKTQARSYAENGMAQLTQMEDFQALLAAVDEFADEETLQTAQTLTLKRQLSEMLSQLRNAVAVYIQCDAKLINSNYPALRGAVEGALSETGVFFVNDPAAADWAVYITAVAQEYAKTDFGSVCNYAVFVEVYLDIERLSDKKRIYSNSITSKTKSHTKGFDHAAREAYQEITPQILSIIQTQIAQ